MACDSDHVVDGGRDKGKKYRDHRRSCSRKLKTKKKDESVPNLSVSLSVY